MSSLGTLPSELIKKGNGLSPSEQREFFITVAQQYAKIPYRFADAAKFFYLAGDIEKAEKFRYNAIIYHKTRPKPTPVVERWDKGMIEYLESGGFVYGFSPR